VTGPIRTRGTRPSWPRIRERLVSRLVRWGVPPNAVTIAGTLGVLVGAVGFAARGQLLEATAIIAVSTVADQLDGALARASGRETRWGALLDSGCDRVADGAIVAALAYHLSSTGQHRAAGAAIVCLVTSYLVPYTRARAELLGVAAAGGLAPRFVRLKILAVGGLAGGLGVPYGLETVLWLLALLSAVTAAQRTVDAYRQLPGPAGHRGRAGPGAG
jgi:CDP-diacylglycerol--glycerol-3-phosphate 3-phosphatidyltransferase